MFVRLFTVVVFLLVCCFAVASAGAETGSQAIVNFRSVDRFLIVVPVRIGEAGPFDFLVDTGTNTTLIDPALADELKLKAVDRVMMVTPTGAMAIPRVRLEVLSLGPILMQQVEALVQPIEAARGLDPQIRGILGENFLRSFDYLLDYGAQVLVFDLDHSRSALLTGERIALQKQPCPGNTTTSDALEVKVQTGPTEWKRLRLQIDSGIKSPAIYSLPDEELTRAAAQGTIKVTSNLGQTFSSVLTMPQLSLGRHSYSEVPFAILSNKRLARATCSDGLIPSWLFHSMFISHSHGFLIVQPQQNDAAAPPSDLF